jgi:hypothetical protein
VSFQVINPAMAQPSPAIYLQINSIQGFAGKTLCRKGVGNASPLLISGFKKRIIYQSTPSSNAMNLVTIILNSYIDLARNVVVKILGFRYPGPNPWPYYQNVNISCILDAILSLDNKQLDMQNVFGSTAQAYPDDSILLFTVAPGKTLYANHNYTCTFKMKNPQDKQLSPAVSVQIGGDYPSVLERMEKLDTMRHPLLVAGFENTSIRQSNPSTDETNTLTVTLLTSATLPNRTYITIDGLDGTQVCLWV